MLVFSGIWFLRWELCIFTYSNPHKIYVPIENFGDVTTAGEVLQILTFQQWNSESSFTKTTSVTRANPLYSLSSRTQDTHTFCRMFGSEAVTVCFYDWGLSRLRFKHPTIGLEAIDLTDCATTADCKNNVKVSLTVNTTSFSKPTLCQGLFLVAMQIFY